MADLTWLRTFLAIYRTGSLTRAAKSLRLTQPAISQHLKALEVQVGWPLFARHARGVVATPAGEELAALVADHVDALEAIAERMRPPTQTRPGVVHVGGPVDFLAIRILPALAGAIEHGIKIVAHPNVVDEVMAALVRGDLHLAITERKVDNRDLEYEKFFEFEPAIVTSAARSAELRAMKDRAARVRSLAEGPFVAFTEEMPFVRTVLRETFGIDPGSAASMIVPDLRAVTEVVAAGRAVGVLPRPLVEGLLERGVLHEQMPDEPPGLRVLWLVTRRGTSISPRIAIVRSLLREAASRWPKPRRRAAR